MKKIKISRKYLGNVGFVLMFVFSFLTFYLPEVYGDDTSLSTFSSIIMGITVLIGLFCTFFIMLGMLAGIMCLFVMFSEWVVKMFKKFIEIV